jgi:HlyD family secretion protein
MHGRIKKIIPIIFLAIVILGVVLYWFYGRADLQNGPIEASGYIEVVEVLVAPEQSGRVVQVLVDKGDTVNEGDLLLRMDDVLLLSQSQRAVTSLETSRANLSTAQTDLEMAKASLQSAETNAQAVLASTDVELLSVEQALDKLYETHAVSKGEALRAVASSNRAVREAQYQLDNFSVPTNQQSFSAMKAVGVMKERLDEARDNFEPYKYKSSSDPTRQDLKDALEEAQSDYDSAVRRLEYETELEKALANQEQALQDLEDLAEGPDPDEVAVLEARIKAIEVSPQQAEDTIQQARVGVDQAEARLNQVKSAISQAEAELGLIEVQLEKLNLYAPVQGVVISKNVQPGEVIQAGSPVMSIGQLDQLTITVYVPEDRYGNIFLGQEADVYVDSFPGELFRGEVTHIADRAEFTPRNVQTQEGRQSTVFAVELSILYGGEKLKPGMPADVIFGE